MVRQFTFNFIFTVVIDDVTCTDIADCNKDLIFFSAFLDLHSIRDDEDRL